LEYFQGEELFSVVKAHKRLPEKDACHYFFAVIKTMQTLAQNRIAHRDIKAENILVNVEKDDLKLIDFGFSVIFEESRLINIHSGTPIYSAPEVLAKDKFDPLKADLWSSGILLFFMLCGRDF
jgi:5'-AMP-activated protein kinase catalytic alpha subunit